MKKDVTLEIKAMLHRHQRYHGKWFLDAYNEVGTDILTIIDNCFTRKGRNKE